MKRAIKRKNNILYPTIFIIVAVFSSFYPRACSAQNTDSLLRVLAGHPKDDAEKAKLLTSVADAYKDVNPDTALVFAKRSQQLSQKVNDEANKAKSSEILGLIYLRQNKYDSSRHFYASAYSYYEKKRDKAAQCKLLRSIADLYYRMSKFDSAILFYHEDIGMGNELKDNISVGISCLNLAGIYSDWNNYPETIKYYLQALRAFEEAKSTEDISNTMVDLATTYANMGDYKTAEDYVNKSMAIPIRNREILFSNYVNAGFVYGGMKNYAKAQNLFQKALAMADSLGDLSWKNICVANLVQIYMDGGKTDTAYMLCSQLLKQEESAKDSMVMGMTQSMLGQILITQGKYKEGIKHEEKGLEIARAKGQKQTIFEIAGHLADAYKHEQDYKHALYYYKIHYDYSDTLYNEKAEKRVLQMQYEYAMGKKESEISLLNKDKEMQESESLRRTALVTVLIIGIVFVVLISLLLHRHNRIVKRNRDRLLKQKAEIELQASHLEELNKFKDKTFSVLSHDLRGPLASVTSTMQLLDNGVLSQEEFAEMKPEVDRQLASLNTLLDNTLRWAKNYIQGNTVARPERTQLPGAVNEAIALVKDTAQQKNIIIHNDISAEHEVFVDPQHLQIITRNILANAVKFNPNGGTISLDARAENGKIILIIKDSGVGMSSEKMQKLFTPAADGPTYGTEGEKGTGLGLLLCYEFMKANKGHIEVQSIEGQGTSFTLELPSA